MSRLWTWSAPNSARAFSGPVKGLWWSEALASRRLSADWQSELDGAPTHITHFPRLSFAFQEIFLGGDMILEQAVAEFLSHCRYGKNLSPKTLQAYEIDLRQFAEHVGDHPVAQNFETINKGPLRGYIQSLFGRYAEKSIKRKVATLKAFINFLEREDVVAINPFRKMEIRIREKRRLPRTIALADLRSLFRHLYDKKNSIPDQGSKSYRSVVRDIAVLELLFATGARVSEICKLKGEDVDLEDGSIRILGKGGRERIIQICDHEAMEVLRSYRDCQVRGESEYFFNNRKGSWLSDQTVRAMQGQAASCCPSAAVSRYRLAFIQSEGNGG
jgi:integrase/recombinase XerD